MAAEKRRSDVIISALSCGGGMKCGKAAAQFDERPTVLKAWPGPLVSRKNGSILDALFETERLTPRRVAVICVDEGAAYAALLLRNKKDAHRIDTIFVMDGYFTRSLKCWTNYAERAARGGFKIDGKHNPKLWLTNSNFWKGAKLPIQPLTAATRIVDDSISAVHTMPYGGRGWKIPRYIRRAELPEKIKVYSGEETPKYKFYHRDTLVSCETVGNVARFEYEGNKLQDHLYLCHHVQPRFWRWLSDLWKDPTSGVFYT
jgi:hypothetical protein